MKINRSLTINRPPGDLYSYWHNLDNLAQLVPGGATVTARDDRVSHWTARMPTGQKIEWDAELTEDIPGKVIAWRSLGGASLRNSGSVRFEPAQAGPGSTLVSVSAEYMPPGGILGTAVAKLGASAAEGAIDSALRKVKQQLEQ